MAKSFLDNSRNGSLRNKSTRSSILPVDSKIVHSLAKVKSVTNYIPHNEKKNESEIYAITLQR